MSAMGKSTPKKKSCNLVSKEARELRKFERLYAKNQREREARAVLLQKQHEKKLASEARAKRIEELIGKTG